MTKRKLQEVGVADLNEYFGTILECVVSGSTGKAQVMLSELSQTDKAEFEVWAGSNAGEIYSYVFIETALNLLE